VLVSFDTKFVGVSDQMAVPFKVTSRIDEDRKRIVFKVAGYVDSEALIDTWIETYASLAEPWTYDRLFDYRRADGLVDFGALERFSKWWHERLGNRTYTSKVAVVVNNSLDEVRVHTVATLFPYDLRESFMSIHDAEAWLDQALKINMDSLPKAG